MSVKPRYISFRLDVVLCCIKELLLLRNNLSRNCRPRLSAKCENLLRTVSTVHLLQTIVQSWWGFSWLTFKVVRRRNEHIGHLILKTAASFKALLKRALIKSLISVPRYKNPGWLWCKTTPKNWTTFSGNLGSCMHVRKLYGNKWWIPVFWKARAFFLG